MVEAKVIAVEFTSIVRESKAYAVVVVGVGPLMASPSLFIHLSLLFLPPCPLLPHSALWWLENIAALNAHEWPQPIIMLILSLTGCLCVYPRTAAFVDEYRTERGLYYEKEGHLMLARRFMGMNDSKFRHGHPPAL